MHNWSTDEARLKRNPLLHERFKLEQMINYGLNGNKLSILSLKKHWDKLVIDPQKRELLKKMIWAKS